MAGFIELELHKKNGPAFVKPSEICSMTIAPEGGTRVVTRQKQIYYVIEDIHDVDAMIKQFFKNLEESYQY